MRVVASVMAGSVPLPGLSPGGSVPPIVLTVAYVSLPYWLGIVVARDRWRPLDAALLAGLCALFFARIILKDVRHRLGDAAYGKRTLLLRLGKGPTCVVSVAGAVLGSILIVVAISPPPAIGVAIGIDAAAIVWMLLRLRDVHDLTAELVTIGTAARAGNMLLITVVTWLLLSAQGAEPSQASLLVGVLTVTGAAGFLLLAVHPERARIAYKA